MGEFFRILVKIYCRPAKAIAVPAAAVQFISKFDRRTACFRPVQEIPAVVIQKIIIGCQAGSPIHGFDEFSLVHGDFGKQRRNIVSYVSSDPCCFILFGIAIVYRRQNVNTEVFFYSRNCAPENPYRFYKILIWIQAQKEARLPAFFQTRCPFIEPA